MALLFFSTKKNLTKKGSYFTFFFLSFPKVRILKSMSVVVTLCDFFLQYFQIDGSYLFRPKSHQKCREKLHPKKIREHFSHNFSMS